MRDFLLPALLLITQYNHPRTFLVFKIACLFKKAVFEFVVKSNKVFWRSAKLSVCEIRRCWTINKR